MRLNSRTGIEGPPVSSLNCDRPLQCVILLLGEIHLKVSIHTASCIDNAARVSRVSVSVRVRVSRV